LIDHLRDTVQNPYLLHPHSYTKPAGALMDVLELTANGRTYETDKNVTGYECRGVCRR
jgi:hypothetical protein